ncbi:MAG: hypothetical protein KIT83_22475, partial [Bryobacterales bacterium]|nr:hypothetical protein [Bryobacterales bacterium]
LPDAADRHLDAMARYQVCNWATVNQQNEVNDQRTRVAGAMATAGVTLAIVFLRQPFTSQGGKPERIEAFLTGTPMDVVFQQVVKDADLMTHIEQRCQPLITEMFTFPQ